MPLCVLAQDNPFGDIVAIEGEFVRTFFKDMPSDYVKLYLYCQYALNNDVKCESFAALAVACGITLDAVKSGLEYFSHEQLLRLVSQRPLVIEVRSVKTAAERKNNELPAVMTGYSDYFAAVRSVVGRELKPSEMEKAREWVELYTLPEPVIMLMIQHCMINMQKSGKKTRSVFAYIDSVARTWATSGITTLEEAEYYLTVYELDHHRVNDIMLHIGIRRMPSVEEVKLYEKWVNEWKMSHDTILAACSETTKTATPSFAYLDKIIQNLREGLTRDEPASKLLAETRQRREEAGALLKTMGLSGTVTQELLDIVDAAKQLGFDSESLHIVARQLAKRAYKSVGSFESEISLWVERGITTAKGITEYANNKKAFDADIKEVYKVMGAEVAVNDTDRRAYTQLREKHGFTKQQILHCAGTVRGGGRIKAVMDKLVAPSKQTAAHKYAAREATAYDDIFTKLDALEDVED